MASKGDVSDYYTQCASEYELVWTGKDDLAIHYGYWDHDTKNHTDSLLNMNRVLAEKAGIKRGSTVLDAGCGIGGSSIWIAKNIGARVTGITICQRQMERARVFAEKHGVDRLVRFYNRDYLKTGFRPSTFDVVWALESVCYAPDKRDFIREARRVLKPGGRLVVADGFATEKSYDRKKLGLMSGWLDGWMVPNLAEVKQFLEHLRNLGFKRIEYRDITENVMPSSVRMYRFSIPGFALWKLLQLLGLKSKMQVDHVKAGIYQHRSLKRGLWHYGIFCAKK